MKIKVLAYFAGLLFIINIVQSPITLGNLYYFLLFIILLILLIGINKPRINLLVVWLIFIALLSIIFNDIPYFFKPYQRLIAFVFVLALIGPFIRSSNLIKFKWELFKTANHLIVLVVILSFGGLILNLPIVYGKEGFIGVFNHSMMMAPMASISVFTCFYWVHNAANLRRKLFYFLMAIISLVVCISAGSRSALIAVIIGLLYYFYRINQKKISRYIRMVFILIGLVVISYPLWEKYTTRLVGKIEYSTEKGDAVITRKHLWERRFSEIKSSPFFGIGFSNDSNQTLKDFYKGEGQIEPGSSWLVVFAMLGVFGFIPFFIIYSSLLLFIMKDNLDYSIYSFLGALIIFFGFHMFAEGYVLSAGSGLFFYFWLILGIIDQLKMKMHRSVSILNL